MRKTPNGKAELEESHENIPFENICQTISKGVEGKTIFVRALR